MANALGAVVALVEAGVRLEDAVAGIAAARASRAAERVAAGLDLTAFVDYSHKPGAVEAVLRSLRPVTRGSLIIVLGCGGDRDRAKRPMMGARPRRWPMWPFSPVTIPDPRIRWPSWPRCWTAC